MMGTNGLRIALCTLGCLSMAGCCYDTQSRVDSRVGSLGGCPMDTTPPPLPSAQGSGTGANLDSVPATPPTTGTWCPGPVSAADEDAMRRRLSNQGEQADHWYMAPACRPVAYEAPASALLPLAAAPHAAQPLEIPGAIPG